MISAWPRIAVVLALGTVIAACGGSDGPAAVDRSTSTSASTTAPSKTPVATLAALSGATSVDDGDGAKLVAVGTSIEVREGSTITVEGEGLGALAAGAGAVVRFGSDATAKVASLGASGLEVDLATGSSWWSDHPDDDTDVRVLIGGVTASSVDGRGYAACDADGCFVGSVDGSLTVVPDVGGPSTTVDAGHYVTVKGGALGANKPFPPSALRSIAFAAANLLTDAGAGLDAPATGGGLAHAAVDGPYAVTYRTVASDRDAVTGEGVERAASVRTDCKGLACALVFSTELKSSDGSVTTVDSTFTFDGRAYHGRQSTAAPCQNPTSGATATDGIDYTADVTMEVTAAAVRGGVLVATEIETTTVESNVVNAAGRAVDCRINSGTDPYSVHTTVHGVGHHR